MASTSKRLSQPDVRNIESHEEFRDLVYCREVLQLEDITEDEVDGGLAEEAAVFGIDLQQEVVDQPNGKPSLCESDETVVSGHVRSGSTGSQASASTGMTSTSSNDLPGYGASTITRRRSRRRSLSFSEYDKYMAQIEKQQKSSGQAIVQSTPPERAASLFSVSSRRSYKSIKLGIKNGLKNRLRLVRRSASFGDLKYVSSSSQSLQP
jgi:hypothetical protein